MVLFDVQILREAMRTSPSVVYLPHLNEWWHVITEAIRASFVSMFNDLDPSIPVLLLATSDVEHKRLSPQVGMNLCCYCTIISYIRMQSAELTLHASKYS